MSILTKRKFKPRHPGRLPAEAKDFSLLCGTNSNPSIHMIYMLTAIGLTPGGISTVHIYTQTIHRTTQIQTIHRTIQIQTIKNNTNTNNKNNTNKNNKYNNTNIN